MELTPTQRFILESACAAPYGVVQFGAGDRKGTRIARHTDSGVPVIVAYQTPEFFLTARKLLRPGNERHTYQITNLGRAVLGRPAA